LKKAWNMAWRHCTRKTEVPTLSRLPKKAGGLSF